MMIRMTPIEINVNSLEPSNLDNPTSIIPDRSIPNFIMVDLCKRLELYIKSSLVLKDISETLSPSKNRNLFFIL